MQDAGKPPAEPGGVAGQAPVFAVVAIAERRRPLPCRCYRPVRCGLRSCPMVMLALLRGQARIRSCIRLRRPFIRSIRACQQNAVLGLMLVLSYSKGTSQGQTGLGNPHSTHSWEPHVVAIVADTSQSRSTPCQRRGRWLRAPAAPAARRATSGAQTGLLLRKR